MSTFLIAEVRMVDLYLASAGSWYWSESTPIDQAPFLVATVSIEPVPEQPAAA